MKILQCQTHVSEDKKANLDQMRGCFEEAARCGADLITFGEMFTCPYETKRFPLYAEEEGGESFTHFASLAREYGILVSAGSIPEKAAEKDGKQQGEGQHYHHGGDAAAVGRVQRYAQKEAGQNSQCYDY